MTVIYFLKFLSKLLYQFKRARWLGMTPNRNGPLSHGVRRDSAPKGEPRGLRPAKFQFTIPYNKKSRYPKDTGIIFGAFRLNQNPWFYQGWVKRPWQIKTSMIR